MMGFCVNLFTVDASFEMGPRWIFLTDGPFVTISRERVLIFDKNTCAWFAMPERRTEGQRERERKRESEREEGNYLIEEKFVREKFRVFFGDFVTFSLWNVFLNKICFPCQKTLPAETFSQETHFLTTC